MRPITYLRSAFAMLVLCATLLPAEVLAQKSRTPALIWQNEITLLPNTVRYRDSTLQGFTFTVYETDHKHLMQLWQNDHSPKSASITKGDPAIANEARITQLDTAPVTVIASAQGDKKMGHAAMTIGFYSATAIRMEKQEAYVRELAVRYNRAVVESQILAEENAMARANDKLTKSVAKEDKLNKNLQKSNASLNKLQAQRAKEQSRNAKIQGDVVGAEKQYALSDDVKDLKKLTKARSRNASGEAKVAKLLEKEAKLQSTIAKYTADLPGSAQAKEGHAATIGSHKENLSALRKKLSDIR